MSGGPSRPVDPGPAPRLAGGVGESALAKNVGSQLMIRFAPAFTARPSTSNDASAVVTMPRHGGRRVTGLERVDRFRLPFDANVLLDAIDDFLRGDRAADRARSQRQRCGRNAGRGKCDELTS